MSTTKRLVLGVLVGLLFSAGFMNAAVSTQGLSFTKEIAIEALPKGGGGGDDGPPAH